MSVIIKNLKANKAIVFSKPSGRWVIREPIQIHHSAVGYGNESKSSATDGANQCIVHYATAGYGAISSIDGGNTFQSISTSFLSANVSYANDRFFIGGTGGTSSRFIMIKDGISLGGATDTVTSNYGTKVAYGNGFYLACVNGSPRRLYKSFNGTSFSGTTISGGNDEIHFMGDHFIYGSGVGLFKTTDGVTSTALPNAPLSIYDMWKVGNKLYYGRNGGELYVSYDNALSWSLISTVTLPDRFRGVVEIGNLIIAAKYMGGAIVSTDNGSTFTDHDFGVGTIMMIHKFSDGILIRTPNHLYKAKVELVNE